VFIASRYFHFIACHAWPFAVISLPANDVGWGFYPNKMSSNTRESPCDGE
jgi:hypothetical protein